MTAGYLDSHPLTKALSHLFAAQAAERAKRAEAERLMYPIGPIRSALLQMRGNIEFADLN